MTAHDAALVKAHPKERLRRHSAVALALFALLFTLLLAVIAGFGAAMAVVDRTARVLPDYERIDLAPYLAKESYTEEDYDVLYHQTGLSRTAVDALEEKEMLLEYQERPRTASSIPRRGRATTPPSRPSRTGISS